MIKKIKSIIKLLKILKEIEGADKEHTRSPYWMIIDPRQNFRKDNDGVHNIASMITGPFFSRRDAEAFLARTRYNFSRNAVVYCDSGHNSYKYDQLFR